MAEYVLPQALVFQDLQRAVAPVARPLRACIIGGHAQLVRFAEEDERESGFLGYYDHVTEECFTWPNRVAGAKVNQSYTKVWMTNALLQYFEDTISAGSTITKVAGYNNRIRSATLSFKANGEDFPRSGIFLDRDVKVGDTAKVRAVVGPDVYTLWTYVLGFVGDPVDATIDTTPDPDVDNADTQSASSSITKISGPANCVEATADHTAYNGLEDGDINETYTIIVTESSAGGDFTTARLRVLSASGRDDDDDVQPAASGSPTAIGSRGLTVTFDTDTGSMCSSSASEDEVSPDDLIAGQTWEVEVSQAFTANTATGGGTYGGDQDTTYIVEVTKGGLYAAEPEISVTTTNGIDISGPTKITAASTAFPVGSQGVTIAFNGTGLRKGDKWYIAVTAETEGAMRTLILGHNLDTDIPSATEVDLTLFIRKPELQIEANREGFAPLTNWTQSETEICLQDGIIAYDETWTDDGEPQPLPVLSEESQEYGKAYVEYRAWRTDLCNELNAISDTSDLDAIPGPTVPDNELKWGVFKALENSNGTAVKYIAVCDPEDDDSWIDVLERLDGREDVYGLVPLTRSRVPLDAFKAHADSMSDAENGLWRVLWTALIGVPEKAIVNAEINDDEEVLAVIEDDPNTSGTQYTIVRTPGGDGKFVTREVRPGDIVRGLYTGDGFGNFTYTEFVVDAVINEDTIRLLVGHSSAINVAQKIEVWRNLSATEEAAEIALDAGSWASRRVRAVWPDTIETSGTEQEGYFICAALAGLRSGILPHQGMTNLEISGFTDVPRTTSKFNKTQLDSMAAAGVWIVTQQLITGQIFTRHAVTTGDTEDINEREEMITSNLDSISFRFKETFEPFIGISNVTPSMESIIRNATNSLIEVLKGELFTATLGAQLIEGEIEDLRPHATLKDRYVLILNLDLPETLNNIEAHLVV